MQTLKIITILMIMSVSLQQKQYSEDDQHCGQYGFRCLDIETFQICDYPDLDGITDVPEIIHKCHDHNVCDEDNPAYCTPLDPLIDEIKQKSKEYSQKISFAKRGQSDKFPPNAKDVRICPNDPQEQNFKKNDFVSSVKSRNTFGFDNDDDDDVNTANTEKTTTTSEDDDSSYQYKNYDCESYGFFPDIDNTSMFWFCDHHSTGQGFDLHHMVCSPGRIFNPVHKECVLIGITRNIRNELIHASKPLHSFMKRKSNKIAGNELTLDVKFSCKNRFPGKYADEVNCRIYHYCLPLRYAQFNELTFICPDHLAYDDEKERCNSIAYRRCIEEDTNGNGKSHIEFNAILLQKQKCKRETLRHDPDDCSGYHLCYNDKVVHLKCPNSYQFDENLLTCQPQHLVSCRYGIQQ